MCAVMDWGVCLYSHRCSNGCWSSDPRDPAEGEAAADSLFM